MEGMLRVIKEDMKVVKGVIAADIKVTEDIKAVI